MKLKLCTALLTAATILVPLSATAETTQNLAEAKRAAAEKFAKLPLSFEPTESAARFQAHSGGYTVSVGAGESSVAVADPASGKPHVLRFGFVKSNPSAVLEAVEPLPGVTNYYLGNDSSKWRLGVRNYAKLHAREVYPGVDVVYYGDHRRLEFDFVVAPKADPNAIAMTFDGMEKLYKDAAGDLVAELGGRPFRFARPYAYQRVNGVSQPVAVDYELSATGRVQLRLGAYDRNSELIIDPVVSYATFLGGSNADVATAIAVDSSGVYVTGQTCSVDFPNILATNFKGACDAFVTKYSLDGSAYIYTTVLGGNNPANATAIGSAIAVDGSGQAYVAATTNIEDMPGAPAATNPLSSPKSYQGGDSDAYIAILAANGTLLRSTYLGGAGPDSAYGIAVDTATPANVIITGQTCSDDFPGYNAFQAKIESCVAFITKLDNLLEIGVVRPALSPVNNRWSAFGPPSASGGTYYFSGFLGGQPVAPYPVSGTWTPFTMYPAYAIVADTNNPPNMEITFTGGTSGQYVPASTTTQLPIPNWNTSLHGITEEGSITWENLGPRPVFADAFTEAYGIALDPPGDIFVAGGTNSTTFAGNTWPCSPASGIGAWVVKVGGGDGACRYVWSLEKTATDVTATIDTARAVAVDASGRAYITGTASSSLGTLGGGYASPTAGGNDAFLFRINQAGSAIDYAVSLGGSGNDQGLGVAVDPNFEVYVTGSTKSIDFPIISPLLDPNSVPVAGAPLQTLSGAQDAFISKFTANGTALVFSSYLGGSDVDQGNAIAVSNGKMYIAGNTYSSDLVSTLVPETGPYIPPQPTYAGAGDGFIAMIDGSSLPTVSVTPGSLQFAAQDVGTRSTAFPVDYYNSTASASVNIASINFSGDFSQVYVNGNPPDCTPGQIAANTHCDIWVAFTPSAQGTRSGTLTISDDASSQPHVVNLSGQGAVPYDVFSTSTLTFPAQVLNTTSSAQSVTLQNTGKGTLQIASIAITGDFNISANNCGTSVAPGGNCTISVTFTPIDIGTRSGSLTITDGAAGSPHVIALSGTTATIANSISPTSLTFTTQAIGIASATQTVTVQNSDSVNSLYVSGAVTTGDFKVATNNCISIVLPGGNCTLLISFTPTATGTRTGTLTISGDGKNMPTVITLLGTGAAGSGTISLSVSSLTFTSSAVGTATSQTLTLTNASTTSALTGLTYVLSGTNSADFVIQASGTTCTGSLAASTTSTTSTCTITIGYTPTLTSQETATLTVSATGASNSSQTVSLTGNVSSSGGGGGTGDFTMTASSTGVSVVQGSTATYTFLVTPQNGSKDTITFSCSGPVGSSCSASPNPLTMDGSTAKIVTLIVGTTGGSGNGALRAPKLFPNAIFYALLPFSFFGMMLFNKRRGFWLALTLVVISLLMFMTACGSSSSPSSSDSGLASGSYTVVFTGKSNASTPTTQSITLTLVVSKQ
jgi:hypothetical protein